jgi:D-tagatose-1,6-bisphosphate aldolase subunit GatZ/KbaZ
MGEILKQIAATNRGDGSRGIYSVCSAHRLVIEAAMLQAQADRFPLLIEATCNQVNHQGGYTGMRPRDFRLYVHGIARQLNFPIEQLILGGDHLGPNPWRSHPAAEAMEAAKTMVTEYVRAGFSKLHLDASMACGGDREPLPNEVVAERAAQLCAAAESAADPAAPPLYIIGTEVPVPGGEHEQLEELAATSVEDLANTLDIQRNAFATRGLERAWERVIGVVVQPGVEFDHSTVVDYQPNKTRALREVILDYQGLVYEAHSTDYQTEAALADLVKDHFAILKVGPALTYAAREAIFALSYIEDEWIGGGPASNIRQVLDERMRQNPHYWERYYAGSEGERSFARKYSFSDRSRYYWTDTAVEAGVETLFRNLSERPPPITVLSQFMPSQYAAIRAGKLDNQPRALVRHRIGEVIAGYARACGLSRQ